ncbi:MAG: hypothetical protein LIO58_06065, partial [Oscillospiraceae bacterium]|nr:hypothetical protein [Oscillospiraceae bacterium]
IIALEEFLNVRLFDRSTQFMKLTETGAFFQGQCQHILNLFDSACAETRLRSQGYSCCLRLGVPYYSANSYLGPFPSLFCKEYPDINLSIHTSEPDVCITDLFRGEYDAILLVHMDYVNSERVIFQPLYKERMTVLMNKNHALAARDTVSLAELKNETFLQVSGIYREAACLMLERKCAQYGFSPRMSDECYGQVEAALIELQQSENCILLSGKDMGMFQFHDIKSVELSDLDGFRYVSLIYPKDSPTSALKRFATCFLSNVGEYGWSQAEG